MKSGDQTLRPEGSKSTARRRKRSHSGSSDSEGSTSGSSSSSHKKSTAFVAYLCASRTCCRIGEPYLRARSTSFSHGGHAMPSVNPFPLADGNLR